MAGDLAANEAARVRYIAEFPVLEAAAEVAETMLQALCRSAGIRADVKVRAKATSSVVKKIVKNGYADPWGEVRDKVGARIIVETLSDMARVRALFESGESGLTVHWIEDKSDGANVGSLYYPGIHVQVDLPDSRLSTGELIECEIQIRTKAQDLWSVPSHTLVYKPALEPPKTVKRRVLRLSVLVEIFDEEVERAMDEARADPAHADAVLLRDVEAVYLTFVAEPGEGDLSLEVLAIVSDTLLEEERASYGDNLRAFAGANHGKLEGVYQDYGVYSSHASNWAYWLLSQPESLLVFERIEERPAALANAVRGTEIEEVVEKAFAIWGRAMPA